MALTKKFATLLIALCALSACGVKPSTLPPPQDIKDQKFPRTYPDIDTDPAPYVRPTGK